MKQSNKAAMQNDPPTEAAPAAPEQLLTIAQAAERLALSRAAVRRLIARGRLSVCRPSQGGRSVRVTEASLPRWIERRTSEGMLGMSPEGLKHVKHRPTPFGPSRGPA
jgi:excisionase family DNA binding protein